MQFNFRGDIIDEATAIKKGVVKRDEYNHLWIRADFNNEPIILDANIEINKEQDKKERETVKVESLNATPLNVESSKETP